MTQETHLNALLEVLSLLAILVQSTNTHAECAAGAPSSTLSHTHTLTHCVRVCVYVYVYIYTYI
jgi:predicted DNA-binding protein with PD1-like motif